MISSWKYWRDLKILKFYWYPHYGRTIFFPIEMLYESTASIPSKFYSFLNIIAFKNYHDFLKTPYSWTKYTSFFATAVFVILLACRGLSYKRENFFMTWLMICPLNFVGVVSKYVCPRIWIMPGQSLKFLERKSCQEMRQPRGFSVNKFPRRESKMAVSAIHVFTSECEINKLNSSGLLNVGFFKW